jgi:SAM-dependent methyltransferase
MMLVETLKRNREAFLDRHAAAHDRSARLFSATTYALWKVCRPAMARHCAGLVLDAGSGRGSWRSIILETASGYESIDNAPRAGDHPTWIGDVCDMPQVPSGRYDTVVCHQVVEHLRRPWCALAEFNRVLKPGGTLVLTVPHLSRRHELPHDYFRLTQEGLTALLEDAGYAHIAVEPYGGILSFLHHQTSFILPGVLLGVPVVGRAAATFNALLSWLLPGIDAAIDRRALMPVGILAVAQKPVQPTAT